MCKGGQKKDWDESRTPESSPSVKEGFTLLTGGGSVATRKGGKGVSREKLIVHDRNGRGGVGQGRGGGGGAGSLGSVWIGSTLLRCHLKPRQQW